MNFFNSVEFDISMLIPILIYFFVLFFLGIQGFRKTKSFADYALGGRKLSGVVGAMNVGASDMSSWLLMGLPAVFYLYGVSQIWMMIGLLTGSYLSWKIVAVRLRKYSEIASDSITLSSFLENRFEDKTGFISLLCSVIIIFFFLIYIASGFVGAAKLFAVIFNINYFTALIIAAIGIVFYAFLGGFLAVSWADLMQGFLILIMLVITPFVAINNLDLNYQQFINKFELISPSHLDFFANIGIVEIISFFAWGLGYFGQPHIISKYMAIKDPNQIKIATKVGISWMSISLIAAALTGLTGFLFFHQNPLEEAESVFVSISYQIFHPIILGVLVSAILAAIMSTINSQIIICCSHLAKDFYQRFFNHSISDKKLLKITRALVILVSLIAIAIAFDDNASVLSLVSKAWAGLGASIGPIILFALYSKKTSKISAIVGIISGAFAAIFFSYVKIFPYEILPAFLTSSLLIFVTNFFSQKYLPESVNEQFKKI
jgi:SSS family solute:Na+ symporter